MRGLCQRNKAEKSSGDWRFEGKELENKNERKDQYLTILLYKYMDKSHPFLKTLYKVPILESPITLINVNSGPWSLAVHGSAR